MLAHVIDQVKWILFWLDSKRIFALDHYIMEKPSYSSFGVGIAFALEDLYE